MIQNIGSNRVLELLSLSALDFWLLNKRSLIFLPKKKDLQLMRRLICKRVNMRSISHSCKIMRSSMIWRQRISRKATINHLGLETLVTERSIRLGSKQKLANSSRPIKPTLRLRSQESRMMFLLVECIQSITWIINISSQKVGSHPDPPAHTSMPWKHSFLEHLTQFRD